MKEENAKYKKRIAGVIAIVCLFYGCGVTSQDIKAYFDTPVSQLRVGDLWEIVIGGGLITYLLTD